MRDGKRVSVWALLILSASTTQAADRGFYFGASGGQATYDFDLPAPVALIVGGGSTPGIPQLPPGTPLPPLNPGAGFIEALPVVWGLPGDDENAAAWSVTAGYRANRYLAIEASYVSLGTLEATQHTELPPILGGGILTLHRELETAGPALTVFGILPVNDKWELYARAGILFADTDLAVAVNGNNSNSSSLDSEVTTVGAGVQFDWREDWSARLEFMRSLDLGGDDILGGADVDGLSLAVIYRL